MIRKPTKAIQPNARTYRTNSNSKEATKRAHILKVKEESEKTSKINIIKNSTIYKEMQKCYSRTKRTNQNMKKGDSNCGIN